MFEFEIRNNSTGEVSFLWGRSIERAFEKANISNPEDFTVLMSEKMNEETM